MVCGEEHGRQPPLPNTQQQQLVGSIALSLFLVAQDGVKPLPKDRGVEQGDVDGQLECSLAPGMVAAEVRLHIAGQQAAGTVPRVGASNQEE